MADISHKTLGYAEAHVIHFAEYANAAARTGAVGLTSADNKKVAFQSDTSTLWMLTDYSGPTWIQVMGTFYSQAEVQALIVKSVPIGTVDMTLLTTAPTGWLFLNGETLGDATSGADNASATYEDLFAIIKEVGPNAGTEVWGDHDAITLPDMSDKFPLGAASSLGATGGATTKDVSHTHTTPDHTLTTAEMPAHTHAMGTVVTTGDTYSWVGTNASFATRTTTGSKGGGSAHNHGATGSGGSAVQDVLNPYVKINYMVKFAEY